MTAKCPRCGAVFAYSMTFSLIHLGPLKYIRCPACGKRSMINTAGNDPVTWPERELPPEKMPGDL